MPKPFTIKRGSAHVRGYPLNSGRWVIAWRESEHAPRKRTTCASETAARQLAAEKAAAIANGLTDVLELSNADRDAYRLALQKLEPFQLPLLPAVEEFAAAKKIVSGHSLIDAAHFFVSGQARHRAIPPTAAIVQALLDELADDRRDVRKYIGPLRCDLTPFAAAFPDLAAVTEEQVRAYLRDLRTGHNSRRLGVLIPAGSPVSARRRDNVRDALVRLFSFAQKKDHLPIGKLTAPERIPRISENGPVTTYPPETVASILAHFAAADPDWLPWAAIAAFAGLRTSEIFRLDWSAFHWDVPTIAVPSSVARKVRIDRQAPLLPALAAWLQPWRTARGPVIARKFKTLEYGHRRALLRLKAALQIPHWETNALRHSFGSHRLAIVKSVAHVALEMGNSPQQVRRHYNDPKPEPEAIAYFATLPTPADQKIVQLHP